jgi:hypothetical protein
LFSHTPFVVFSPTFSLQRFYCSIAGTLAARALHLPLQQRLHELHHQEHSSSHNNSHNNNSNNNSPRRQHSHDFSSPKRGPGASQMSKSPSVDVLDALGASEEPMQASSKSPPETPTRARFSRLDRDFRRKFKLLPDDEVLVRVLDIVLLELTSSRSSKVRQVKRFAKLWLGTTHMVLHIKIFGNRETSVIPYRDVLGVQSSVANSNTPSQPRKAQSPNSSNSSSKNNHSAAFGDAMSMSSSEDRAVKRVDSSASTGSDSEDSSSRISVFYQSAKFGGETNVCVFRVDKASKAVTVRRSSSQGSLSTASDGADEVDADFELLKRLVDGVKVSLSQAKSFSFSLLSLCPFLLLFDSHTCWLVFV